MTKDQAAANKAVTAMQNALNYINHVGANWTMRGQPHPQQWLVDELTQSIKELSGKS